MRQFAFLLLITLFPQLGQACSPPNFSAPDSQVIPLDPDQSLFSHAVLAAVNFERCKAGKVELREHITVRKAALLHSRNMAKTNTFNHISRAGDARTVKDRAKRVNLRWRWIAENIALPPRYKFTSKKPFTVVDRAKCQFLDPDTNERIAPHSYSSMALSVVSQWMASKGHRDNILSRYADKMGAALIFDNSETACGRFYITQVFTD
jgi:uncharacterized protein YkwD